MGCKLRSVNYGWNEKNEKKPDIFHPFMGKICRIMGRASELRPITV